MTWLARQAVDAVLVAHAHPNHTIGRAPWQHSRLNQCCANPCRWGEPGTVFLAGHGGIVPIAGVDCQVAYLEAYRRNVRELAGGRPEIDDAAKIEPTRRITAVEPFKLLAFYIVMGADAVARELVAVGLVSAHGKSKLGLKESV